MQEGEALGTPWGYPARDGEQTLVCFPEMAALEISSLGTACFKASFRIWERPDCPVSGNSKGCCKIQGPPDTLGGCRLWMLPH